MPVKQCLLKIGLLCPVSLFLDHILVLPFVKISVCIGNKWFQWFQWFQLIGRLYRQIFVNKTILFRTFGSLYDSERMRKHFISNKSILCFYHLIMQSQNRIVISIACYIHIPINSWGIHGTECASWVFFPV